MGPHLGGRPLLGVRGGAVLDQLPDVLRQLVDSALLQDGAAEETATPAWQMEYTPWAAAAAAAAAAAPPGACLHGSRLAAISSSEIHSRCSGRQTAHLRAVVGHHRLRGLAARHRHDARHNLQQHHAKAARKQAGRLGSRFCYLVAPGSRATLTFVPGTQVALCATTPVDVALQGAHFADDSLGSRICAARHTSFTQSVDQTSCTKMNWLQRNKNQAARSTEVLSRRVLALTMSLHSEHTMLSARSASQDVQCIAVQ